MIDQEEFYQCLQDAGIEFFTGVPDTLLNDFCLYLQENHPQHQHLIAANEGGAVAIAAGHHLATGKTALVYMQNSGMGNALNPLLSLVGENLYSIPLILLIGWRGDPSVADHPQHNQQGRLTPVLLDDLGIPFRVLDDTSDEGLKVVSWAADTAREINAPVAIVVKKDMLQRGEKEDFASQWGESDSDSMSREEAMRCVLESVPTETRFVATTGRASRELHEIRRCRGEDSRNDFLNVGAMGHALSIATGMALSAPNQEVVCLDGDAAAIMHLGSLAVTAPLHLPNLLHVVLNNAVHESVGGQPTVGVEIDFTRIAESVGYYTTGHAVSTESELRESIAQLSPVKSSCFIDCRIRKGMRTSMPPLKVDHKELRKLFMDNITTVREHAS